MIHSNDDVAVSFEIVEWMCMNYGVSFSHQTVSFIRMILQRRPNTDLRWSKKCHKKIIFGKIISNHRNNAGNLPKMNLTWQNYCIIDMCVKNIRVCTHKQTNKQTHNTYTTTFITNNSNTHKFFYSMYRY